MEPTTGDQPAPRYLGVTTNGRGATDMRLAVAKLLSYSVRVRVAFGGQVTPVAPSHSSPRRLFIFEYIPEYRYVYVVPESTIVLFEYADVEAAMSAPFVRIFEMRMYQ